MDATLQALGFEKCPTEHAVYKKSEGNSGLLVGVYVDDLIITGGSKTEIEAFKSQMKKEFKISNLVSLSYYYLAIEGK